MNIYNYDTKYKERAPEETIQIIKDFFIERGYSLELVDLNPSESGTWGCAVQLRYNNIPILTTCGKGMTETFCMASGFAELYERFCNKCSQWGNLYFMYYYMKYNKEKNNFYLDKNEKLLTEKDYLEEPLYQKIYQDFFNTNKTIYLDFVNSGFNGQTIGTPWFNFSNKNDIKYLDPRIIHLRAGSSGMAAGNTLEEAMNQGLSELFEHWCFSQILQNANELTFYKLNLNKIENIKMKNIINRIKNLGNEVYVIDLSYTFNYPVLLSIVLNKKTYQIDVNCGSFPVFDIALERIFTELYQNLMSLDNVKTGCQHPYIQKDWYNVASDNRRNFSFATTFPETVFMDAIEVDSYNSNCFLPANTYNNTEIHKYYEDILKRNNLKCYCYDTSLSNKIFAVWMLIEGLDGFPEFSIKFPELYKNVRWNLIHQIYQNMLNLFQDINDNNFEDALIKLAIQANGLLEPEKDVLFGQLTNGNILSIYRSRNEVQEPFTVFCSLLAGETRLKNNTYFPFKDSDNYGPYIRKYMTLQEYKLSSDWTKNKIKDFFNCFNETITDEDYENCFNADYLIRKIYIEPFKEAINSGEYANAVKGRIYLD